MTTEEMFNIVLSRLNKIESLVAGGAPPSYQPGGKDWRLQMGDGEVRAYNRKKGVERRKGR